MEEADKLTSLTSGISLKRKKRKVSLPWSETQADQSPSIQQEYYWTVCWST